MISNFIKNDVKTILLKAVGSFANAQDDGEK